MIESILFFSLGFLCSAFLALMIAPALWRRAVALTRRRIEAAVPMSLGEIEADKDRMRAEFAMSTRRLEMSIQAFREKAASQIIEINRNQEQLKKLASERAQKSDTITELEKQASELREELRRREDQLKGVGDRLAAAEQDIEAKALELDKLGRMYDEASLSASNRQIELVAREADFERVSGDVGSLRAQRKEAERRLRDAVAEAKGAQEALRAEKKKVADLEKRLERLTTTLTDREDKLDRREKELARLRGQLKSASGLENDLSTQLASSESQRVKLEAEIADLTLQMSTLLSGATGGDVEKAMEKLGGERDRLEKRVTALMRENRKLKSEVSAHARASTEDWDEQRRDNALLREQINDLAAEVVKLTEMLDGPDSPIGVELARDAGARPATGGDGRPVSLADRVKALKEAASVR
ncbi:hypothetical protein FQ775_10190 [Nitratireductor mangrovi]|uniref:Uncharacterized protein n=1 Tax=Nitratireductor mangrovi TaxID=2599600 RepID=A0A5B8KYM7_9HYPH|nr:hypothetical protein [Nitratireductor mangrovi]QDZ00725.1 hypothetical protein FQ775_10190 [Nitratireductor mangrovi]